MPGNRKRNLATSAILAAAGLLLVAAVWLLFLRPTRILVANTKLAQQADLAQNNDCRRIRLQFCDADELAADRHVGTAYELENGEIVYVPE